MRRNKVIDTNRMPDLSNRVVSALSVGADGEAIRSMLLAEGLTEYQAYLTLVAGKMILKGIANSYASRTGEKL